MKNILFDLDGTIIEPAEGIIGSILYALNKMGIEEENENELSSFIGPPLIDSFKNRFQLDEQQASKAVDYYREFYAVEGIFQNVKYEGIEELLIGLHKQAYSLFVATSKPTFYAKKIIQHYGMSHLFEGIIGSHLDNTRKNKKDIIHYVLEQHQLNAKETIMIGDTKFDMIGAEQNSIQAIGVTYGHGQKDELIENGAKYLVDNCLELKHLLNEIGSNH